jgi:hypothetical protein
MGRDYRWHRRCLTRVSLRDHVNVYNGNLKSDVGIGGHQVCREEDRMEKSLGIAVLAYLFVLRLGHHELVPGNLWSLTQLQHALRLAVASFPRPVRRPQL